MIKFSEKQKKIRNKWKKSNIKINRELRDIIHGYLMSDGYINKSGSLYIQHSIKQQKFVKWLYKQFILLCTNTPIRIQKRLDKHFNTQFSVCRFQTRKVLKGFHFMWYRKNIVGDKIRYTKKLPTSLACFFNSTFISIWFAGAGTKMIGQHGAKFEVTCYTPEERLYLKKLFKQKFDINVKILRSGISKEGTTQWSLFVPVGEYEKFRIIITQMDLIPCLFPYKLCKKKK